MAYQKQVLTNKKGKTFRMNKLGAGEKRFLQFENALYLSEHVPVDAKILGLDLAKYKTGYTVLQTEMRNEKQENHHVETGLITCKSSFTIQKSVSEFYIKIKELLEIHRPQIIAYEYIAVATDITGFKALAKVEAALQIAINQVYSPEELPLLLPISVMTVKKLGLMGSKPDIEKAKALAEKLEIKRKLDKRTLDKLSIMVATEENFGMSFTDDNECDSFLVANCAVAITSFLNDTVMEGRLKEFDDKPFMKYLKSAVKTGSNHKNVSNQIAISYLNSGFPIKENSLERYSQTVKEIKHRFYNIVEESDPEDLESDGLPDDSM